MKMSEQASLTSMYNSRDISFEETDEDLDFVTENFQNSAISRSSYKGTSVYLLGKDGVYNALNTSSESDGVIGISNKSSQCSSHLRKQENKIVELKRMKAHMEIVYAKRSNYAEFRVPEFSKTSEEENFIRKNIALNFLFSHANEQDLSNITKAFEKVEFSKDSVVIEEGENGDYFYLVECGLVQFIKKGDKIGVAAPTDCFGDLALLYSSPRAATCIASTDCKLWRIDRQTFLHILSHTDSKGTNGTKALLRRVPFLSSSSDLFLEDLAKSMKTKHFSEGETIITKGKSGGTFYILKEGEVKVHDILSDDGNKIDDRFLKPGAYFGELSIVTKEKANGNVTAVTNCEVLTCPGEYFDKMEGSFEASVIEANYIRMLTNLLSALKPEPHQIKLLSTSVSRVKLDKGTLVHEVKFLPKKGIYFVLSGSVKTQIYGETEVKKIGDVFGIETIFGEAQSINAEITDGCRLGVLSEEILLANTSLTEHRKENQSSRDVVMRISMKMSQMRTSLSKSLDYSNLRIHSMLGKGAFGTVWLTTFLGDEKKKTYALKEIKKKALVEKECLTLIMREARILTTVKHQFIIDLTNVYHNKTSLLMLFPVMPGGELHQLMEEYTCFSERASKFYVGVILEALSYLHQKNILFRDLKPENVLLDEDGYCILVDFGFAKQTREKTFTLCGTPLYLAPEIILSQGQDARVDYWAWTTILFEVVSGEHPFYENLDSQVNLFKKICKGNIFVPDDLEASDEFYDLVTKSFKVDGQKRIGALNGCDEIRAHKWFENFDFESLRKRKLVAPWKPDVDEEQQMLGDGQKLIMNSNERTVSEEEELLFADFGAYYD